MAVIISMAAILFHERKRVCEIESEVTTIHQVRRDISAVHHQITILASYGESVIGWDEEDSRKYRERRLKVDSLLEQMKRNCIAFVNPMQLDTLRALLKNKEEHLYGIMQAVSAQDKADSLLQNHLPAVAEQAIRNHTVTRKKKGIAGWFGKKETIQVPQDPGSLRSLNIQLISMLEEREDAIDTYTDRCGTAIGN